MLVVAVAAVMPTMVAAVMPTVVAPVMGESSATKIKAWSAAVIVAWSAVIVAGTRFIAGPDPAIAVPCSPTYQTHLFGELICNRCAQSTSSRHRVCPRADERSCAGECRHSRSCKNQTTHFFLLLGRKPLPVRRFSATISRTVGPIYGRLHFCIMSNCRSAIVNEAWRINSSVVHSTGR